MNKKELKEGIWRIADGVPLHLGNMTIKTVDTDKLLVIGWTSTINFESVSRDSILIELNELKDSFSELTETFHEMKSIVKQNMLTIEYHMAFDDSGKVGIALCSEIEEQLNWYINE